ncbi:MAG: DUF1428 domain-containing protein [Anaeromyxobacter sp.]
MAGYVDGFVLPLPRKSIEAYRRLAELGAKVWMEHGALEYRECVGEDLAVKFGLPFPRGLKVGRGETVVFAWIIYRSRAHRDRVTAKVMKDPRLAGTASQMPFDPARMLWGGFEVLVQGKPARKRAPGRRPAR